MLVNITAGSLQWKLVNFLMRLDAPPFIPRPLYDRLN
jgi:hypothetical protein